MNKYPLIGISICAVVLLVLGSLSNVVGYQTVQSSNQSLINERINQKELLFQTIVDIANNNEIQGIILKSQITREGFFNPDVKFSIFNTQVFTKNNLKHMYIIGLILSKTINKSKIHSLVEQYKLNNQGMQKEITAVIEKDVNLNREMTQLSNSKCNCGNDNISWNFPVLCTFLAPIFMLLMVMQLTGFLIFHLNDLPFLQFLTRIVGNIVLTLNCSWALW